MELNYGQSVIRFNIEILLMYEWMIMNEITRLRAFNICFMSKGMVFVYEFCFILC